MGASASTSEGTHLNKEKKRVYRKPSDRAKTRYDAAESTSLNTPYEASIDKFDYLIVFPLTTGPYVHPTKRDETDTEDTSRIGWREIRELWHTAVPGSDTKKNKAIAELARVWKQRTGSEPSDDDTMRTTAWLTIARETIVDQLMNKCGLQIKLSANASHIFCRVRAPIKLLELQTDKDNYRLQLRGEVDPGSEEFWNVEIKGEAVELDEEKRLYTVDEARIILEKLYRAGKIAASELTINTDVETQSSFSRRVHTLERIADKVPITNKYIAYSDFLTTKPHLRYLYQTYPSVRGTTLFRSKDRILLTKRIMDSNIDISVLEAHKVVTSFFALHDANRGEKLTVESLSRTWTSFWLASAYDVGAPTVTHPAYDEGEALWFFLRPFAQPIAQIREYFGEKVAIYFAWLGFYTYYLVIPAILGIAIEVVFYVRGYQDTQSHIDWPLIGYGVLMLTWAIYFDQSWMAECKMIALKWGTRGFESEEKDRPQFKGETSEVRSPITNRKEPYFSDTTRNLLIFGSALAIMVLIAIDVVIFIAILYMQNEFLVTDPDIFGKRDMYFLVSLLIAVEIQLMSWLFTPVIEWLNQAENHRTETDYEDHLVVKFLGFETFNSFGACVFTAFLKEKVFDSCYNDSCVKDLRMLIYAIIVVRLAKKALQVTWISLKGYFRRVWTEAGKYSVNSKKDDAQALLVDSEDETEFMAEINREKYHGTFNDFAEAYMQFSYITLFFVVVPILPIIALVENLVKIRIDAYTLCALTRRPHVEQCEDAGYWSENLTMMIYLGVFMSVALFIFTEADFSDYDADSQLITFFAAAMALMLYAYFLQYVITSEPDIIDEIAKRQEFIVNKFVKDFEDDDENLDIESLKGNVEDTIDVDGLNLYDLRKGLEISDADFTLMEELERQRRELLRELKMNKERLQDVYKTEHFNENSGVGETKHGLPLGRVSVKLVEIQNLRIEDLDLPPKDTETYKNKPLPVMLRVSFVGTKAGAPAPAPQFGKLADTERLILDRNGLVAINQALGPFAPIRTVDARVQFDVLFLAEKADPLSVASTSIELRDLSDQAQQNKILPLRIRTRDGADKVLQVQDQKASARLYVNLTFQYSKVVPIRNAVYIIQDKLQTIERELSRLKAGKKREY